MVFILCWVAYACIYLGRVNISVALPDIQNTFLLSKAQAGLLGSLFFWFYAFGQLINGRIGDKASGRLLVFAGLLATAVLNGLFGLMACFAALAVVWALNGYCQSMLWGPISRILSCWFPYEKRSGIVVAVSTSMIGGYMLAWGGSGAIITRIGWQWAFFIPFFVLLAFSLVWLVLIRSRPEDCGLASPNIFARQQVSAEAPADTSTPLLKVMNKTGLWFVVLACIAQSVIKDGITLWAPTYIMETQKLDIQSAALSVLFIPLMNFAGMIAAGWLNKKLKYHEKTAVILLFCFGILMITGLLCFGVFGPFSAMLFLGLSSASMYGANTLLIGVIPMNYMKYGKVSSIAGFLDFCSYFASGFTSFITGIVVSSRFGWNGVIVMWVLFAALGLLSLFISRKRDKTLMEHPSTL